MRIGSGLDPDKKLQLESPLQRVNPSARRPVELDRAGEDLIGNLGICEYSFNLFFIA